MKRSTPWDTDRVAIQRELAGAIGHAVGRALGRQMPQKDVAECLAMLAFSTHPQLGHLGIGLFVPAEKPVPFAIHADAATMRLTVERAEVQP